MFLLIAVVENIRLMENLIKMALSTYNLCVDVIPLINKINHDMVRKAFCFDVSN